MQGKINCVWKKKRLKNYSFDLWFKLQFRRLCPTLCDPIDCNMPGLHVHRQLRELPKLMSLESVMPSNHLILCHPLLFLPSIFPSIRIFSNESALHLRWPKIWSFSFISPSHEYSGLTSFRMDWLDLLAVQGTLKSLLFGTHKTTGYQSSHFRKSILII